MTAYSITCSRPHESILPRPHRDAHQRYLAYGPVLPMDEPKQGVLGWLLGLV